jgi:hypothetical protein
MILSKASKTAVVHQPDFLSYLGFFHRFLHSDIYVALDCVQFATHTSRSWQNRDKIKTPYGEKWLTVGVLKTKLDTNISDVMLSTTSDWRTSNLNLLRENYRKAPFFSEIFPLLEMLYEYKCERMLDFNLKAIQLLMECFDIRIPIVMASSLGVASRSNDLLVDILVRTGCDTYLSGTGARSYFESEPFERAGIKVIWQEFTHPVYPQQYGDFIANLSSIDLLFNCGILRSREVLRSA